MYGYPEQFIPLPEIGAASHGPAADRLSNGAGAPAGATAMSAKGATA